MFARLCKSSAGWRLACAVLLPGPTTVALARSSNAAPTEQAMQIDP
jgi:hypothetical protein